MRHPLLDRFYCQYLNSEDSATFIQNVSRHYNIGALERLGRSGQRVSRRAAILALGFVGSYEQNEMLGRALSDRDRAVRLLADHGIRQIWFRVPDRVKSRRLGYIARLNGRGRHHEAHDLASELIAEDAILSEAFHQRAIALYSQGLFADASMDCQTTIELNPYHFPAMLAEAHCYMQLDEGLRALQTLRRALAVYPDLENVRAHVRQIERSLDEH